MYSKKSGDKGPTDYRNSSTGRFTTQEYARKHPGGTEGEHNRKPTPPPKKK